MEYEVSLAHVSKTILGPEGYMEPLCNSCLAPDCTNPIRERVVSIMGIPKKIRLHVVNNMVRQVIECKGYAGDKHVPLAEIPKINPGPQI